MEASAEVRPLKLLWAAASRTIDDLCARLLEDAEEDAPLAIRPGRLIGVLRADDRLADIAHPQCAIAVGNDCVVPILGPDQLVVGVNRERSRPAVNRALGFIHGRSRERRAHVLERRPLATSLAGSSWMRTAGFC
jgi:hypothetical protein